MNPPTSGLRPLFYDSKQVAKVELRVQPGDVLHVSEDVAAQLQAADGHFRDGAPTWTPDQLDTTPAVGDEGVQPAADPEPAPAPVQAAVKKSARKS